ncbi:putative nonstructural protein [Hemipteran phasma-related virus OKIAV247]|uniref:Putative nonstructural protein n=1 Tax=Hemipteran phasma-related virus OKIAV247 TaxID=2746303 RepID=A0A7D7J1C6_9VIRU|nr:putative nonstructural protein [Hemipteran phasma-related virus OKIAV247]QMP82171.1 putative nonstructural protein [Hemipteran phasma-related virus OKIAV247]
MIFAIRLFKLKNNTLTVKISKLLSLEVLSFKNCDFYLFSEKVIVINNTACSKTILVRSPVGIEGYYTKVRKINLGSILSDISNFDLDDFEINFLTQLFNDEFN